MAQLSCRNVVLGYEGKTVVQNLNFEVNRGDYLCIIGENGSGKSTLIRALLRLKSPMSGEILTGDGLEADGIGYLPQQTIVQRDFPASVREIVLSGCLGRFGWRPEASSSGYCWRERSAPLVTCCFWMSRWPGWTRPRSRRCTAFWRR